MLKFNPHFFKRKPRRDYLIDEYKPHKPALIIWLQRLIMLILLFALGLFLLMLSNIAHANLAHTDNHTTNSHNASSLQANISDTDFNQVYMNQVSEGSLLLKTDTPGQYKQLPLLHTEVSMSVNGMILRNHLKQRFKNTSKQWIEAVYVFPLPETAAVDHMRMHIGERIIEGQIKEKQAAKKIYETAKKQGKRASLVEQERPNLFTNSVANIGPGETIIVEIEYQQVLQYDRGDFSLRFPMAITPRYIPGKAISESVSLQGSGWASNTDQVTDASRITPPVIDSSNTTAEDTTELNHSELSHSKSTTNNRVSINIRLDTGFPLQKIHSRYHTITQQENANGQVDIRLTNGDIASDRDFELVWTPQVGYAPKAAAFHQEINKQHYQLVMLLPPDNASQYDQPLAREVTYVIDTSGSMHGVSMQQAKNSLLMALDRLRLHDRFNIIQFNSVTEQLFSNSRIASFENVTHAKKYVQQLQADGGTEMAAALNLALGQQQTSEYVHQVIFLTDGSVGNESALFEIIHNKLGNSRLFTIGIGSAPNSYFMRKAAQFGRGTFTYISDVNEVNEKMSALFTKLESPLMTDLSISIDEKISTEIWPQRIPDLYNGEPIVLAIKSSKPLSEINLQGTRALAPWTAKLTLQQNDTGQNISQNISQGIGTFWARNKIAALMDSQHEGADKSKVRTEIIDVALEHHLVSKYTSLIAVDVTPARPAETKLNKQALAVNLPHGQSLHGQSQQKIFGRLPQTATSAELQLLFGFALLILGLISQWIHWPLFTSARSSTRLSDQQ